MNFIHTHYIRLVTFLLVGILFCLHPICAQVIADDNMDKIFSSIDFKIVYYPNEAHEELDSLKRSFGITDRKNYQGYLDYISAQLLFSSLDVDSSLVKIELAISFFTRLENKRWLTKSQFFLGRIAETSGLMEQAKINYYKAISLASNNENREKGFSYLGIARCKRELEEPFEEEFRSGILLLGKSKKEEIRLYARFMSQLFDLSSSESPSVLNTVAFRYLRLGLFEYAVNVYKVIANSFNAQEQYDSAHYYCDKAMDICESHEVGKLIIPALYQSKGFLYYKQKNYGVAETYFRRSLDLYKTNNQSSRMLYTYKYLHKIDVAKGNYSKSYDDLNEYLKLTLETSSIEKVRLAKVLEINNKVDLMKSQLVQLKIEKKASEFMLYLVVVITIVIIGGLGIYIYLYQKHRKAKIEEINKEFHNLLIGIGEKKLLEHRLNKGVKRKDDDEIPLQTLSSLLVEEGDLGDSFDNCYMETINLFTDAFPQLTKTEIRYSVMICLKLPMEIIAKVQNVQISSIRKAKQRIRIKLKVSDNLEVFLQEVREKQISDLAI